MDVQVEGFRVSCKIVFYLFSDFIIWLFYQICLDLNVAVKEFNAHVLYINKFSKTSNNMALGAGSGAIIELMQQHGVLAVMAGALLEEILVPIPSPIIPMAAGVILVESQQLLPAMIHVLFYIAIPASLASVLSSYFVYSIAYYGGRPAVEKYGKWLDLSWDEVQKFERHFGTEKEKYYVAGFRSVPIVPLSLISGAAGLFRMDWKTYGLWSFIGMLPRNFGLAMIGWYVRDDFIRWASQIDRISTIILISAVILVIFLVLDRKFGGLYKFMVRR